MGEIAQKSAKPAGNGRNFISNQDRLEQTLFRLLSSFTALSSADPTDFFQALSQARRAGCLPQSCHLGEIAHSGKRETSQKWPEVLFAAGRTDSLQQIRRVVFGFSKQRALGLDFMSRPQSKMTHPSASSSS